MLTGLSLSFCIGDIVAGRVKLKQVGKIVAATAAATPKEWEELIESYQKVYWREHPRKCANLAHKLMAAGRVEQPRLKGAEAHNIAAGHWLRDSVQIRL